MSAIINPFIRGFNHLTTQRQLVITYEDDCPPAFRPLHESQAHLRDDEIRQHPCIFCDGFALITEGQTVPDVIEAQCTGIGIVRTVVYAVMANDTGHPMHVGDTYSAESAATLIHRLHFMTGHYSRCWEISSAHISRQALAGLGAMADIATPSGLLFEAFRLPYSHAVGVKLIATPWTSENLRDITDQNATQLRQEHMAAGLPGSLVNVLHLAALADTRILIFDPDAPALEGLLLHDHG
tara:strand:+ start:98 stop:814 length:717 start_codon:yes stop_codon:yes gene_type:complete